MSVFIAVPAFGLINTTVTTTSLMELTLALNARGIRYCFTAHTHPNIGELRNLLLTLWYDRLTDVEYMLQVDADMGFPAELVLDMLRFDQPLAGCLYPKKTYPIDFVGRGVPGAPRTNRGFIEVEGFGGGVMLIRRDCITAMLDQGVAKSDERLATHTAGPMLREWGVKRIIRAFDEIETETGRLSEDLSFCRRHIQAGGTCWASGNYRITHVGPHGYSGRFLDRLDGRNAQEAAQQASVA